MKVMENSNSPIQLDAYIKQAQQRSRPLANNRSGIGASQSPTDKVNLSDEAKTIQQAFQASGNASDVREDKVQQAKMEIENGTYRVVGAQVATDMLKESFENDLLLQKINTRV